MDTIRWNINEYSLSSVEEDIMQAAKMIKNGQTIAFPTETVYGLGADATNEHAVAKIFQAKGRPQDNPLIAHVATKEQLVKLVAYVPDYVYELIARFSPGPLTYVLPSNGACAENVTAGQTTVGVRIPSHPIAQRLLQACDRPVAAPSANVSGKPSPTTADHVWEDLRGKISGIIDGGPTGVGVESTVIDCTQEKPVILRPGGITKEQLEEVVGRITVDPALINKDERPKAPGMKYRHYAPEVPLWLVEGSASDLQQMIDDQQDNGRKVAVMASTETAMHLDADEIEMLGKDDKEIAANLYHALRKFKNGHIDLIICEAFLETGIGQAIMNRLRKAASRFIQK